MAEAQLERKRQVLIKLEATSGVAETLAAADGKMRVGVKPEASFQGQRNARDVARATLTQLPGLPGAKASSVKWKCEIVGSGSATTPPAEDAALQASGMARATVYRVPGGAVSGGVLLRGDTVTAPGGKSGRLLIDAALTPGFLYMQVTAGAFANSDVMTNGTASMTASGAQAAAGFSYRPISSGFQTVTLRDEEDGYQKSIFGACCTWKATLEANKQGFWEFEAKGPIISYGDLAMTTGITPFTTQPAILQNALMRVDAYAAVLKSFSNDIANNLVLREDGNAVNGIKGCRIASRRPVGSAGFEMMNASDYDLYNKFMDGVDAKAQCRLGSAVGNSVWFFNNRINYTGVSENSDNGIVVVNPDFEVNGFEGQTDDEMEVLFL